MKSKIHYLKGGIYQVVIRVGEGSAATFFWRDSFQEGTWSTDDPDLREEIEGWHGLGLSDVHEKAESVLAKRYGVEIEEEKEAEYVYDDGGRSKYFKANHVGDCVTRAIAIASRHDYKEIYDRLFKISKRSPRNGQYKKDYKKLIKELGGRWVPCMQIGEGCKTHLRKEDLPNVGRLVCRCSHHLVAFIDGQIHDTYDVSRGGTRCVYGYWVFD